MLYPSIDLLMEKLDSKYTLVSVAAKRARQLQEKDHLTIERPVSKKFVGKALEEIAAGHIELVKEE
ncbi:DNA-directed RNA polymerase subunit omega [Anoxybacillus sp. UARK-01]|uniref:DNA-directed RNA polymerase subunit omega n=1 Tax=Anoxybacillus sp. UARK-01 TaxID=1895648 RepID=UPI0009BAD5C7|nr:DNA-directed RNA polymerase subunit omega [Anoxybacillus sp. UARK-01]OQM46277.1 DNA-directed RNA polymerase subunit omega [Anoxybacillus sp. UARK-01]